MIDLFAKTDFEPLYYDFSACLDALRRLPNLDSTQGEHIDFHMYWKLIRPFGRKQILPIKSFLATQPSHFKLTLWSDRNLTDNELLKPWLPYINFRFYSPITEAIDTILERHPVLNIDDPMVYSGGDLFRALILHKHGGVYVDMDSVFTRSFAPLFGQEFMYKWSFQKNMISSAVMWLQQRSPLSEELLRGIMELPPGGTNWGCENNVRARQRHNFRIFPCVFFNPEWQIRLTPEQKAKLSPAAHTFEPFQKHEYSDHMFWDSFVWHWHNRWEEPVMPGCKYELLEAIVEHRLKEMGLP